MDISPSLGQARLGCVSLCVPSCLVWLQPGLQLNWSAVAGARSRGSSAQSFTPAITEFQAIV